MGANAIVPFGTCRTWPPWAKATRSAGGGSAMRRSTARPLSPKRPLRKLRPAPAGRGRRFVPVTANAATRGPRSARGGP